MYQRYVDLAIKKVAELTGQDPDAINFTLIREGNDGPIAKLLQYAVQQTVIVLQVEDVLTTNWITVKDGDYRKALNDLVAFNLHIDNHHRLFGAPRPEDTN